MTQLEFIVNKVNETLKILTNKAHTQTSAENLEFIVNKVNETLKILTNKAHTQTSAENSMRNQNVKCYKMQKYLNNN